MIRLVLQQANKGEDLRDVAWRLYCAVPISISDQLDHNHLGVCCAPKWKRRRETKRRSGRGGESGIPAARNDKGRVPQPEVQKP